MTNKTEEIRKKCIEANPGKDWGVGDRTDDMFVEKVRLADILLAMKAKGQQDLASKPLRIPLPQKEIYYKIILSWNLLDDNLNHATPETIDFLYSILITKE